MTHEQEPHIILDQLTPDQQAAVAGFECVAIEFSEDELLRTLTFFDMYPVASKDVAPLTSKPDKTAALLATWEAMRETGAIDAANFDDATEDLIASDARYSGSLDAAALIPKQMLKFRTPEAQTAERNRLKGERMRLRFATYAGLISKHLVEIVPVDGTRTETFNQAVS